MMATTGSAATSGESWAPAGRTPANAAFSGSSKLGTRLPSSENTTSEPTIHASRARRRRQARRVGLSCQASVRNRTAEVSSTPNTSGKSTHMLDHASGTDSGDSAVTTVHSVQSAAGSIQTAWLGRVDVVMSATSAGAISGASTRKTSGATSRRTALIWSHGAAPISNAMTRNSQHSRTGMRSRPE